MATNFPSGIDTFVNPNPADPLTSPPHASQHRNANDAITAIQTTLGVNPQGTAATVGARVEAVEATLTGPAGGVLSGNYPNPTLVATGVTSGTYGNATALPRLQIDASGRVTAANDRTFAGVAGELNVSSVGSSVTVGLETISGLVPGPYGSSTTVAKINVDAKGRITSVTDEPITGGGGGAPTDAQYVTLAASPGLSAERVLSGASNEITLDTATPSSVVAGLASVLTVPPGLYGNSTNVPQVTVDAKGRITKVENVPITGGGGGGGGTADDIAGGAASQILYQQATGNTSFLPNGSAGQVLVSPGGTGVPAWQALDLSNTASVSNQLAVGNGGTGRSILTTGNLVIGNGTSPVNFIAPGATNGFVLKVVGGAWSVDQPIANATYGDIVVSGTGGNTWSLLSLTPSPAGTYTNATIQVDAKGRVIQASSGSSGSSPAGNNTQVQFNNSGVFGASSNLTFASNTLSVPTVQATLLKTADSGSGTATTLTVQPGSSSGSPLVGATLALEGGRNLGISGTGGDVTIKAGFRGLTGSNLGAVTVQGGTVSVESTGALSLGTSNTTSVSIGRSGITTTITGGLTQTTGVFSLTGNNGSTISTTVGPITIQPATGLFMFSAGTSAFASTTGNVTCQAVSGDLNLLAGTSVIVSGDGGVAIGSNTAGQSVVVNSTSINVDFRVSGDTDTNLLFTDASADRVGIGTNAPSAKLTINGSADQTGVGTNNTIFGVSAGANRTTASNSTAFGHQAGRALSTPADNTAFGYQALGGSAALTGGSNTAVGSLALSTLQGTGANNTAIGRGAMSAATSASSNTAVGFSALDAITTAQSNTAVGLNAIGAATSGDSNTAVGNAALFNVSTGGSNTAVGAFALGASSGLTGLGNVAVGNSALGSLTSSSGSNVAFGAGAGSNATSGVGAVLIGNNAANAATSINNEIVIGASAVARGVSNSITLGSGISSFRFNGFDPSSPTAGGFGINNITSNPVLRSSHTSVLSGTAFYGFYVGTTVYGSITQGGSTNVVYNTTSDYRLKENVEPIPDPLTRLAQLKPSRYNFIGNANKMEGFLAHELQEVVPYAVTGQKDAVDEEGNPAYQGVDQGYVVPLLTAAVQKLMEQVEALKAEIAALKT